MSFGSFFAEKIYRFKGSLPVFADEVIKGDAAVRKHLLYAKRPVFAVPARHDLSAKRDLHLRPRPDVLCCVAVHGFSASEKGHSNPRFRSFSCA